MKSVGPLTKSFSPEKTQIELAGDVAARLSVPGWPMLPGGALHFTGESRTLHLHLQQRLRTRRPRKGRMGSRTPLPVCPSGGGRRYHQPRLDIPWTDRAAGRGGKVPVRRGSYNKTRQVRRQAEISE